MKNKLECPYCGHKINEKLNDLHELEDCDLIFIDCENCNMLMSVSMFVFKKYYVEKITRENFLLFHKLIENKIKNLKEEFNVEMTNVSTFYMEDNECERKRNVKVDYTLISENYIDVCDIKIIFRLYNYSCDFSHGPFNTKKIYWKFEDEKVILTTEEIKKIENECKENNIVLRG